MNDRPDKGPLLRLKYRILSHLPGERGLRYLRKASQARRATVRREFAEALEAARGGICVDLGANLGRYTREMAAVAGRVYAFEPDPWTATRLRAAVQDLPNVEVIEAAAGTEDGTVPIFRSPEFDADPERRSQSTSIVADKRNIDTGTAIEARMVDFPAFLDRLGPRISLIKMDIEGAEVALLEALLAHPVLARIDHIFVETHETRVPALASRSIALRRRVRDMTAPRIDMDWN